MRQDEEVQADVLEELFWDGRFEPRQVAAYVRAGVVTLRGTIGSPTQKRAAEEAARRVDGVVAVENRLQVQLMDKHLRRDAEVRAEVLQRLADADALIPESVDAKASLGIVTLCGTVEDPFQRHEAEVIAREVHGVKDVWNDLLLDQPAPESA